MAMDEGNNDRPRGASPAFINGQDQKDSDRLDLWSLAEEISITAGTDRERQRGDWLISMGLWLLAGLLLWLVWMAWRRAAAEDGEVGLEIFFIAVGGIVYSSATITRMGAAGFRTFSRCTKRMEVVLWWGLGASAATSVVLGLAFAGASLVAVSGDDVRGGFTVAIALCVAGVYMHGVVMVSIPPLLHAGKRPGVGRYGFAQVGISFALTCLALVVAAGAIKSGDGSYELVIPVVITLLSAIFVWHRRRVQSLDQYRVQIMEGLNDVLLACRRRDEEGIAHVLRGLQVQLEPGRLRAYSPFALPVGASSPVLQVLYLLMWAHGDGEFPESVQARQEIARRTYPGKYTKFSEESEEMFLHPLLSDPDAVRRSGETFLRRLFDLLGARK